MLAIVLSAALFALPQEKPLRDDFEALTGCFAARLLVYEKDGGPREDAMAKARPYHEAAIARLPQGVDFGQKVATAKTTLLGFYSFQNPDDPYPALREYVAQCDRRMAAGK